MSRESIKVIPRLVESYVDLVASQLPDINGTPKPPTKTVYTAEDISESHQPSSEISHSMSVQDMVGHLHDHLEDIQNAAEAGRISNESAAHLMEKIIAEIGFQINDPEGGNMSPQARFARYRALENEKSDIENGRRKVA